MRLSKVVWHEGMYLAPQHFQTQSRCFEDSLHFAVSALRPFGYGLIACDLDSDALLSGVVSILNARGVFSDGLAFNIPGSDPGPQPRHIEGIFSPTAEAHTVYLAVPVFSDERANFTISGNGDNHLDTRFVGESRLLVDESTGRDEQEVRVGRKNFRILLDFERAPGLSTLPLARIRRDGSGRLVYDPAWIPPCLRISASKSLMEMLARLVEMLEEKGRSVHETSPKRPGKTTVDPRELATFWFLHTIHASLPMLRHQLLVQHGHPEELYMEMACLAGGLSTFSLDSHPRDLPSYTHEDLASCLEALRGYIETHLNLILPANCASVPLERLSPYFYRGVVADSRLLESSRWILRVTSAAGEADLISKTPRLVKVCSHLFIAELVRRAVPGLTLTHLPAPPPPVSVDPEAQYFGITKAGPCWEHIVQTREIGVYVPGDLPDAGLELLVVLS